MRTSRTRKRANATPPPVRTSRSAKVAPISPCVVVQQPIDLGHGGRVGLAQQPNRHRQWQLERASGSTLEADVSRDVIGLEQRDVFQEQASEPLAFTVRSARVSPQPRDVVGQVQDGYSLLSIQRLLGGGALALVRLLRIGELAETGIPLGLESVGDQPVIRMNAQVAVLRELCVVPCTLDVLASETVGFHRACLHLRLDGQRGFQGQWVDRADQQLADRRIQGAAMD